MKTEIGPREVVPLGEWLRAQGKVVTLTAKKAPKCCPKCCMPFDDSTPNIMGECSSCERERDWE